MPQLLCLIVLITVAETELEKTTSGSTFRSLIRFAHVRLRELVHMAGNSGTVRMAVCFAGPHGSQRGMFPGSSHRLADFHSPPLQTDPSQPF